MSINGVNSKLLPITCGVPQGSILGPLLFLLYINDMDNVSSLLKNILFADDTNMIFSCSNLDGFQEKLNLELARVAKWFKANKLTINYEKSNYMVFNKKYQNRLDLFLDNNQLTEVSNVKFLGLQIENNLTWKKQIKHVESKVSKGLGILKQLRKIFDNDTLYMIYCTLIFPYIDYCNEIWGNTFSSHVQKLSILQKKAMRIIDGLNYRDSTRGTFVKYKCLKLVDFIRFKTCIHIFKASSNQLPYNLQKRYKKVNEVHRYNTRSCNDLYRAKCKKNLKQNNISISGVKLFNNLPAYIREAKTLRQFKKRLKLYYIQNM